VRVRRAGGKELAQTGITAHKLTSDGVAVSQGIHGTERSVYPKVANEVPDGFLLAMPAVLLKTSRGGRVT
jgi:hypothetical protein